ncbi:MAG: sigma-54 dependent transcriptional regulator [Bryocella sp.]
MIKSGPTVTNDSQFDLPPLDVFFGRTVEMATIQRTLASVSKSGIPLLIQGESGTGKEVCVRLVHNASAVASGRLVKVSCPAIPHALLETELFGYEKGAFTGAGSTKRGRIEEANGGTLFLDEVGSLELGMQSKLLQVLQDGTFTRVGAFESRNIETRLISATNRDLNEQVAEGSFRLDFLYRINAMTVTLLPLRERADDLPDLVDYFLEKHSRIFRQNPKPVSRSMMAQMRRYQWPGNIRQLDNLIQRFVLVGNEELMMNELSPEPRLSDNFLPEFDLSEPMSLKEVTKQATHELEKRIILKVLKANSWNRQRTAKWLKISYRSLLYKLNELGRVEAPRIRRTREEIEQSEKARQSHTLGTEPRP